MSQPSTTGRCLCGEVRFEIDHPVSEAHYCHCTRCQRRTGTGASCSAAIEGDAFHIVSGAELVKAWRHPDGGWEKAFCGVCGAHLFSRDPDTGQVGIRMGAFEGDPGVRPSRRQFTAYAAVWEPIPDDGLERFPESARSEWGR